MSRNYEFKKSAKGKNQLKRIIVIILVVGTLIGVGLSYTIAIEVGKTESGRFCSKCHTMNPMTQSHYASVHGGNNKFGVSAQCVDCHLPHDTLANYIFTKAKLGLNDVFVEVFTDTSEINWTKKREHADSFVFNSGCLTCHTKLEHSSMEKLDPEIVKKADDGTLKTSCISCHPHVGHKRK